MSITDSIRAQIVPITPEGYPFIGAFALVSLVLFWLWSPLGWLGTVATIWCTYFFRDSLETICSKPICSYLSGRSPSPRKQKTNVLLSSSNL